MIDNPPTTRQPINNDASYAVDGAYNTASHNIPLLAPNRMLNLHDAKKVVDTQLTQCEICGNKNHHLTECMRIYGR